MDKALNEMKPGDRANILKISGNGALKKKLLDMGVLPGTIIETIRVAPLGDPVEIKIKGYNLTLRKEEAASIQVREIKS